MRRIYCSLLMTAAMALGPSLVTSAPRTIPVEDLAHEVANTNTEVGMLRERIETQQSSIETFRQEITTLRQNLQKAEKGRSESTEQRLSQLEKISQGLVDDLRRIKEYSDGSSSALTQYRQKTTELEQTITQQNQNIAALEKALRGIVDIMQQKNSVACADVPSLSSSSGGKIYVVKPGDTLDKVARSNNTTIQKLKESNTLKNDCIRVGQQLQIP